MRRRLIVIASCLLLLAPAAGAAEGGVETLTEAMDQAMRTNPGLLAAREEARATEQALPVARADALPQLSASASANKVDRSEALATPLVREQPEYWIASVNATWALFTSGRTTAAIRQARAQIAAAAADYRSTAQDLLINVTRAYANVLLARSEKESQERALANLQEQLRYVEANVREGFLTETDRAQARARVEQARASLAVADAQLVEAAESYSRYVGHTPPALSPPVQWMAAPAGLSDALAKADDYNPVVVAAAARLAAAEQGLRLANANGRPRLSLEGGGAVFDEFNPRPRGDQSEDSVALRLSVPLFAGGAVSARARQQRSLLSAATYALEDARREVAESVNVAWARLQAARANVEASTARLDAADLAQRGMRREQTAGTRSTIDVLNQEQELLSARVDLARAQRDQVVTSFELAAALGALAEPAEQPAPARAARARPERSSAVPTARPAQAQRHPAPLRPARRQAQRKHARR